MGRQHCATGLLAGMALTAAIPSAPVPVRVLVVITTGGASLLPDLDTPHSTAARSLGLITRLLAAGLDRLSLAIYHATRGPRDPVERRSGHRLFTHTLPAAALAGLLAGLIAVIWPPAAAVVCTLLGGLLTLPLRGFFRLLQKLTGVRDFAAWAGTLIALLAGGFAWWTLMQAPWWWWVIPVSVTAGCIIHILGDAVTNSGVPILWCPGIGRHRERRWAPVRAPLTFNAGGPEELLLIAPLLVLANAISAAWVTGLLGALFTAWGA